VHIYLADVSMYEDPEQRIDSTKSVLDPDHFLKGGVTLFLEINGLFTMLYKKRWVPQ
jgi:hypothetical protein